MALQHTTKIPNSNSNPKLSRSNPFNRDEEDAVTLRRQGKKDDGAYWRKIHTAFGQKISADRQRWCQQYNQKQQNFIQWLFQYLTFVWLESIDTRHPFGRPLFNSVIAPIFNSNFFCPKIINYVTYHESRDYHLRVSWPVFVLNKRKGKALGLKNQFLTCYCEYTGNISSFMEGRKEQE